MKKEEYIDLNELKGDDRIRAKDLENLGARAKAGEQKFKVKARSSKKATKRFVLKANKERKRGYASYVSSRDDYNLANYKRK